MRRLDDTIFAVESWPPASPACWNSIWSGRSPRPPSEQHPVISFLTTQRSPGLLLFGLGGDTECFEEFVEPAVSNFRADMIRRSVAASVSHPVPVIAHLVYPCNQISRHAVLLF